MISPVDFGHLLDWDFKIKLFEFNFKIGFIKHIVISIRHTILITGQTNPITGHKYLLVIYSEDI